MSLDVRVAFIHGITELGGAEKELLLILRELKKRGVLPLVVCPKLGPFTRFLAKEKIETKVADFPAWRKLSSVFARGAAVKFLSELLSQEDVDIVHVNDIWWVPQALRAVKNSSGKKMITLAHVRQEIECGKIKKYELDQLSFVFAVSHQIKQSLVLAGIPEGKVRVLHSGIELDNSSPKLAGLAIRQQYGVDKSAVLVGTVASLFPRKGYEVMLEALRLLIKTLPNIHYFIIGKGDAKYEESLRLQVREYDMDSKVHFLGFQENVFPILEALDLYVHPALMEGFGIAVLEAMAMGKPIVATRVGGIPEIVVHEQTGLLVDPNDSVLLAKAIATLLKTSEMRTAFQVAGKERAEQCFSLDKMIRDLMSVYVKLADSRKSLIEEVSYEITATR